MPHGKSVTCNMVIINIGGVQKMLGYFAWGYIIYTECEGNTKYPRGGVQQIFCMGIQYFGGNKISCDTGKTLMDRK